MWEMLSEGKKECLLLYRQKTCDICIKKAFFLQPEIFQNHLAATADQIHSFIRISS